MAALQIRDVHKRFGTTEVLKGIDMEIENGEFVVLVGPSGCGKSTLLNIIAGLEQESSGSITIGGRPMARVAPKDRDIAMVFQSYALYPTMTVRDNITFGMECRGVPKAKQQEGLARVARLLQIETLLSRRPGQLSGGQRQRVAIGRALVRDPVLFLFDEPLSNLDAQLRVEMRMEIKQLHARIGSTIVYVTHDQIEAMTMATRIAIMQHGEVQQFANPNTVYSRPANLFVARFMGSPPMNTLTARLQGGGDHAATGGLMAVIGVGDAAIHLPAPPATPSGWAGREVILGIRPECIAEHGRTFGDQTLGDKPGRTVSITVPVAMVEPTGAETIVLLNFGAEKVLGRIAPDVRVPIGANATFAVDTRSICLFDTQTERLIA